MPRRFLSIRACSLLLSCFSAVSITYAQGAKQTVLDIPIASADRDHVKERSAWFMRGRLILTKPSAELRRRAQEKKMQMRSDRNTVVPASLPASSGMPASSPTAGFWTPLGPVPLASDASGTGLQDYHQVAGRATAVAIDPADASGNTVYIGGAQGGVWKSTNAANGNASSVAWIPVADDQATLSVGSIAIQPGNSDPAKSVILIGTGEANNSADSYFGLGILRSTDAGNTWTLISTANPGSLSFSGLGGTHMAFSTANTVVAAMGTTSEGVVDGSVTANTTRGLYTSSDAGLTWTYNALLDPGNQATDAASSSSVAYDAVAGLFLAAIRFHGFYSSPDGTHWTRLANQPGGGVLNAIGCPAHYVEQPGLSHLPRRDFRRTRAQRDVRLVYLLGFFWQCSESRPVAESQRRRNLDANCRQRNYQLRRCQWLRSRAGLLQLCFAGSSQRGRHRCVRRRHQPL